MSGFVFISYSHDWDGPYVARLAEFLQSHDIDSWFDREIVTGERWEQLIRQQIDNCAAFIVVMTPQAEASTWVSREISRAESWEKPILPLLLVGQEFFRLAELQYEDVSDSRLPGPRLISRLRALTQDSRTVHDNGTAAAPVAAPVAVDARLLWQFKPAQGGNINWSPSIAWAPNGKYLVVGTTDTRCGVLFLEAAAGKASGGFDVHWYQKHNKIAVSPDGWLLASAVDHGTSVWNLKEQQAGPKWTASAESFARPSWSSDGSLLMLSDRDDVRIVSGLTGEVAWQLIGHTSVVMALAWTSDNRPITAGYDGDIWIWDIATGASQRRLSGHTGLVTSLSCAPDGRCVASGGSDSTCRIWDLTTGSCVRVLAGHAKEVTTVAYSHDGHYLATGSSDRTVRIWDVGASRIARTVVGSGKITSIGWSPDCTRLAAMSSSGVVDVWEVWSPEPATQPKLSN